MNLRRKVHNKCKHRENKIPPHLVDQFRLRLMFSFDSGAGLNVRARESRSSIQAKSLASILVRCSQQKITGTFGAATAD